MTVLEDEVDFGRYWASLAARWWLLVAGLIVGALVGIVVASSSKQVNRATVTVYLGQPLGANGGAPVQTLGTNPTSVRTVIHSGDALDKAEAAVAEASVNTAAVQVALAAVELARTAQTQQPPAPAPVPARRPVGLYVAAGIGGSIALTFLAMAAAMLAVAVAVGAVCATVCLLVLRSMWADFQKGR